MSGWGLSPWGLGPWGLAPALPTFGVEDILAVSERSIRVTFTSAALRSSVFRTGSALNLRTWDVSVVGVAEKPILIAVREISGSNGRQFELYTLRKFPGYQSQLSVLFPSILSSLGTPIVGATSGVCAAAKVAPITPQLNKTEYVDISNVPSGPDTTLGVIQTASSGDYGEDVGDVLLRKMVMRRLITVPGTFFHIRPSEFGLGLRNKEPLMFSDLRAFKSEIERQVLLEPDAAEAQAIVELSADGVLSLTVRVRRATNGREITVSTTLEAAQVVL